MTPRGTYPPSPGIIFFFENLELLILLTLLKKKKNTQTRPPKVRARFTLQIVVHVFSYTCSMSLPKLLKNYIGRGLFVFVNMGPSESTHPIFQPSFSFMYTPTKFAKRVVTFHFFFFLQIWPFVVIYFQRLIYGN